ALVQVLAASGLMAVTLGVAAPSQGLLLVPLALLTATTAATLVAGRFPGAAEVGGMLLPPALAGLTWVLGDLAGLDGLRAVPVLVVLAAVVVGHPRAELEVTASIAAGVAALTAIPLARDETVSLALHLTLAGALVVVHSLVHPSRRPAAWAGTALLVLATWVRLYDLGVQAPEPYTMPTALLLLGFGLHRMRRDASSSTALALLPGLALATVPTFLHVLATDPVSLRAALLGAGCLVLAVGGAQLRWSAPLLVGATVGGLLALLELAPYAVETPQWVVIGIAGTTLVVVGITWERRVVELQRAASYVGRLR
ncbi:SCO7613 C-terminal domain-containing membrane protein, partial [Nocardioides sp.]|uniref:SCO7613 C-terminal domain-containing membrane protein n=1 Tax=Nocardioides sp. TaxID=35761 RepID=UPI0027229A87